MKARAIKWGLLGALIATVVFAALIHISPPEPATSIGVRFDSEPLCMDGGKVWHPRGRTGWCYMADKPR